MCPGVCAGRSQRRQVCLWITEQAITSKGSLQINEEIGLFIKLSLPCFSNLCLFIGVVVVVIVVVGDGSSVVIFFIRGTQAF